MVKSLLLSTSDVSGGAARAAYRLHSGLREVGVESNMLVASKTSGDASVIACRNRLSKSASELRTYLDAAPLLLYPNRDRKPYSVQWVPGNLPAKIDAIDPDIINLHWVCGGFLSIETVAFLKRPLVWSLHDMWPFTGGCHYDRGCERYLHSCGACPELNSRGKSDLSRWTWRRKKKAWQDVDLTIVALSRWLAQCARKSSLFEGRRIEIIPNGLNIDRFKPVDKQCARGTLDLPSDRRLVLFSAVNATTERRKGFDLLKRALDYLSGTLWQDQIELMVLGANKPRVTVESKFTSHYLGFLTDDISLNLVYAAADVFVAPSRQDNLPNTVMEALACGVPCVAFDIGGMPDLIDHLGDGYLAQQFDIMDLAYGIQWVLEDEERHQRLSDCARRKAVQKFDRKLQARRYLDLYEDILARR